MLDIKDLRDGTCLRQAKNIAFCHLLLYYAILRSELYPAWISPPSSTGMEMVATPL